jgi:hypothetical protein
MIKSMRACILYRISSERHSRKNGTQKFQSAWPIPGVITVKAFYAFDGVKP